MDLTKHIKELLYRHDCVIVPGLGALVANYEPADINYSGKIIYPPRKNLVFNRNLKYNDGLLIGHIAEQQQSSLEGVRQEVEKKVREISSNLQAHRKYVLEDLGYFVIDQKNTLQFHPELKTNLMLESYGLSFIRFRQHHPSRYRKAPDSGRAAIPMSRQSIRRWTMAVAAASILTAAVIISLPPEALKDRNIGIGTTNLFDKNQTGQIAPAVRSSEPSGPEQPALEAELPHSYHIIVGSYENFSNARDQISRMRAHQYDARLLFTGSDKFRISVFSSEDEEAALRELEAFRREHHTQAWLYREPTVSL